MKLMSTDSCWKPFWKTPVRKALKDENNFSKAIPDRLRIPSHNKRNLEEQGKRFWGRSKRQVDQTRLYLKPTFSCLGNPTVLATKAACGHPIIKNWKKKILQLIFLQLMMMIWTYVVIIYSCIHFSCVDNPKDLAI